MGLSQLMNVMILFCASMSYNYCCLIFYIIYSIFDFIQMIDPLGLFIQNGFFSTLLTSNLIIVLIAVIYEPIAIYYAF